MFFRRGLSDGDGWLNVKLAVFSIGAMLALFGMGFRNNWLMGAAGLVLLAGIALRWLPEPGDRERRQDQGQDL